MKKIKRIFQALLAAVAIAACIFLYTSFSSSNVLFAALFLLLAFGILSLSLVLLLRNKINFFGTKSSSSVSSHTIVDSVKRVFKVVASEGHFTEIVDIKETKQALSIFKSTKKALIVVKASVHMGFDLSKVVWEIDEAKRTINFSSIPAPEILSITPEINYYTIDNGLFNKFNNEDFNKIQADCVAKIEEAALASDLPELALRQVHLLLSEMDAMNEWKFNENGKRLKLN